MVAISGVGILISILIGFAAGYFFNKFVGFALITLILVAIGEYALPPDIAAQIHHGFATLQHDVIKVIPFEKIKDVAIAHAGHLFSDAKNGVLLHNQSDVNELSFLIGLLLGFKIR